MKKKKDREEEIVRCAIGMAGEEAKEAGSITYSPRCTVLATLPHRDPGDVRAYGRSSGGYSLFLEPGSRLKTDLWAPLDPARMEIVPLGCPFGIIPRLLLAWLTAEAVRTKSRILSLGDNVADFLTAIDLGRHGGPRGDITRLRNQMERLFTSRITVRYEGQSRVENERMVVVQKDSLWWDPLRPTEVGRPPMDEGRHHVYVVLGEQFYQEIIDRPVPLDMRVLQNLRHSSLAMDIYSWMTYRMSYLEKPTLIPWASLKLQFGADYARLRDFKKKFLGELPAVQTLYSHARFSVESERGLTLYPSRPSVLKTPPRAKPKTKSAKPKTEIETETEIAKPKTE